MGLETEKAKFQQIAEILEQEILLEKLAPGARIQSVRGLAAKFKVSITVIQSVFEILEQKGLIERRHGSGTFVREKIVKNSGKVAFLFLSSRRIEESYHFQVFRGVCSEMQKHGFTVELTSELDIDVLEQNYVGIIFSSTISHETIKQVMTCKLPCAVYGNVTTIDGLCEVNPDFYGGSIMAVEYLQAAGSSKIIFLKVEQEDNLRNLVCFNGYIEGLRRSRLTFDQNLVWTFKEFNDKLDKFYDQLRSGGYAFYIPNDSTAFDINNRLRDRGVLVPEEVSLIGFYNRSHAKFVHPALSTVGFDHELMGVTVAEKLRTMIAGKQVESILIPVEVIERNSVMVHQSLSAGM